MSGRRHMAAFAAASVVAASLLLPAAAMAQPADEDSMTLVVEIPERTAAPTPDPTPWPAPSSSETAEPDASGALPPTGGEAMLWLLLVGGGAVAVGVTVRGIARDRQSRTAPRS